MPLSVRGRSSPIAPPPACFLFVPGGLSIRHNHCVRHTYDILSGTDASPAPDSRRTRFSGRSRSLNCRSTNGPHPRTRQNALFQDQNDCLQASCIGLIAQRFEQLPENERLYADLMCLFLYLFVIHICIFEEVSAGCGTHKKQ